MKSSARDFEIVAEVRRGGMVESWHAGAVAVVTPAGEIVGRCGNPRLEVYVRSAAKPFQVLPLLEAGGVDRFRLSPADLALICASHSGDEAHVARALSLLERAGFDPSALRCGAHPPMNPVAVESLCDRGAKATALHNNCSGKHAGQLMACRLLGFDATGYEAPGHPLQRRTVQLIAHFFDVDEARIGRGIDGCSLPTFRLPLSSLARAYARLADPEASGLDRATCGRVDTIYAAMTEEPEMVAGAERFTTNLIAATSGRILGKEGAEGVYALAVRGRSRLGIAVKIADGGERCRDAVVLDVLTSLGCLTPEESERLEPFRTTTLRNWRGLEVGEIAAHVPLESGSGV